MDEARSLQYSITVSADTGQAESNIRSLTSNLGDMQSGRHRITVGADTGQAESGIRRVTSGLGNVQSEATSVGSAFRRSFLEGIDNGNSFASSLKQGVGGAFTHVKSTVSDFKDNVVNTASSIKEGFTHPITTIKTGLGNAIQSAKDKFVSMARSAEEASDSTDGLGDAADDAAKSVRDAGDAADSSGGKFDKFGGILKGVGVALLAATTAVAGFAMSSVQVGMEFDSSMSQVAATMGYSVEELNTAGSEAAETYSQLRSFAMEMGATTAFSATEASNALNYMALAGYDAETSMAMLPNVLNLAAAGGIDLASASDMVTDAQSALGLTLDETSVMVDQMAMAASKSNTSVAQLGEAFLTVGGTAKNLAGGTTELSTMLGVLADNGIKGSEGGTALRNVILSLSAPTDTAAKAIQQLGLEVFDAEGNMRPLNETFGDLQGILGTMSQQEQTEVLSTIFNKVDLKSVNALLGTSADRFGELTEAIGNADGAAQDMANVQLDNLEGDITLFKSALEGAQIVLSDQLTPTLREFVQFGSGAVSDLSTAFQEGGLSGAMSALGTILSDALAMIIDMLSTLVDAGMQLLGALGQGILQNLPTVIEAAAQIIVTIATGIGQSLPELIPTVIDTLLTVVDTIIANLPLILDAGLQILQGLADGIVNALPVLIGRLPEIIQGIIGFLTESIPMILEQGVQILSTLAQGIIDSIPLLLEQLPLIITEICSFVTESLPTILEQGVQMVVNLAMGIVEAIPELVAQLPLIISSIVDTLTANLPLILEQGMNLVINIGTGIISALPELISQVPQIISTIVSGITSNLPQIIETGINLLLQFASGIISAIPQLVAQLPQIISAVVNGLASLPGQVLNIGVSIVQGLWNGISSMGSWLWNQISGWASGILNNIKGFFGIHSPSTVFEHEVGNNMALGVGKGFVGTMKSVTEDMEDSIPTKLDGPEIDIPDPDVGFPSVGSPIVPDVSYSVNPVIGDVNTPKVSDVSYNVTPMVGDFNPPDTSADAIYGSSSVGDADSADGVSEPSNSGAAPVFAPQISIVVQGDADEEKTENLRSTLYDTVRELFREFREEELERQTLKNQYAY